MLMAVLTKEYLPQYLVIVRDTQLPGKYKVAGYGCEPIEKDGITYFKPWLSTSNGEIYGGTSIKTESIRKMVKVNMPDRKPIGNEQALVVLEGL